MIEEHEFGICSKSSCSETLAEYKYTSGTKLASFIHLIDGANSPFNGRSAPSRGRVDSRAE